MSLLIAAIGAVLAAIVESSVLAQLQVDGIKPDLVMAITLGVAMTLGFDAGIAWAVIGGLLLDLLLPARPIGSTTLTLLLVTGLALLVARATDSPRSLVIALTVFGLTFVYQATLLVLLAVTTGVGLEGVRVPAFAIIGVLNAIIAVIAAASCRALLLRFGPAERSDW